MPTAGGGKDETGGQDRPTRWQHTSAVFGTGDTRSEPFSVATGLTPSSPPMDAAAWYSLDPQPDPTCQHPSCLHRRSLRSRQAQLQRQGRVRAQIFLGLHTGAAAPWRAVVWGTERDIFPDKPARSAKMPTIEECLQGRLRLGLPVIAQAGPAEGAPLQRSANTFSFDAVIRVLLEWKPQRLVVAPGRGTTCTAACGAFSRRKCARIASPRPPLARRLRECAHTCERAVLSLRSLMAVSVADARFSNPVESPQGSQPGKMCLQSHRPSQPLHP